MLTISLAGIVDLGEVLVAAALVGTLSVVADVGADAKLLTLVLVCRTTPRSSDTLDMDLQVKYRKPVPSHRLRPLGWKPGLQEQNESVPFTTQ